MFLHALRPSHLTNGRATSGRSTRVASRALTALAAANSARTAAPMSARRSSGPMRVGVFGCFILLNAAFYSIHAIAPDHAARIRRARRAFEAPDARTAPLLRSQAATCLRKHPERSRRTLPPAGRAQSPFDFAQGASFDYAHRRLRADARSRRRPALIVCAAAHTRYLAALSAESDSEVRGAGAMRS